MARTRRPWISLLVGVLVAVLLGPAGGGVTATEPRTTVASIMVPAAAFVPDSEDWDYTGGWYLAAPATGGSFSAPVTFPVGQVNIRRITLYAYDNSGSLLMDVCVFLYRATPSAATQVTVGSLCTTGASGTDPRLFTTSNLLHRSVNTALHGLYVWARILPSAALRLYGVKITYTFEAGA